METTGKYTPACPPRPGRHWAFSPPLPRAENLSGSWAWNLAQTDDLTGLSLFGGNKVRKLEYVLGEAGPGAATPWSLRRHPSNCAMLMATACRRLGMRPILYLVAIVEPACCGQPLLDYVWTPRSTWSPERRTEGRREEAVRWAGPHARLEGEGPFAARCPGGRPGPLGSAGFIGGWASGGPCRGQGIAPDYLFLGTGTGGTLAGLAAGRKCWVGGDRAVNVSPRTRATPPARRRWAPGPGAIGRTRPCGRRTSGPTWVYGEGYEAPAPAATAASVVWPQEAFGGPGVHRKGSLRAHRLRRTGQDPPGLHRGVLAHRRSNRPLCRAGNGGSGGGREDPVSPIRHERIANDGKMC